LGLILSELFRGIPIEIPIIAVVGCSSCEFVNHCGFIINDERFDLNYFGILFL